MSKEKLSMYLSNEELIVELVKENRDLKRWNENLRKQCGEWEIMFSNKKHELEKENTTTDNSDVSEKSKDFSIKAKGKVTSL